MLNLPVAQEVIEQKIYIIRGHKVMLDRDIAMLYGVPTKRLKEQVKRNIKRFPDDFMFQLTKEDFGYWRSQFATSNSDKMGLRHNSKESNVPFKPSGDRPVYCQECFIIRKKKGNTTHAVEARP